MYIEGTGITTNLLFSVVVLNSIWRLLSKINSFHVLLRVEFTFPSETLLFCSHFDDSSESETYWNASFSQQWIGRRAPAHLMPQEISRCKRKILFLPANCWNVGEGSGPGQFLVYLVGPGSYPPWKLLLPIALFTQIAHLDWWIFTFKYLEPRYRKGKGGVKETMNTLTAPGKEGKAGWATLLGSQIHRWWQSFGPPPSATSTPALKPAHACFPTGFHLLPPQPNDS